MTQHMRFDLDIEHSYGYDAAWVAGELAKFLNATTATDGFMEPSARWTVEESSTPRTVQVSQRLSPEDSKLVERIREKQRRVQDADTLFLLNLLDGTPLAATEPAPPSPLVDRLIETFMDSVDGRVDFDEVQFRGDVAKLLGAPAPGRSDTYPTYTRLTDGRGVRIDEDGDLDFKVRMQDPHQAGVELEIRMTSGELKAFGFEAVAWAVSRGPRPRGVDTLYDAVEQILFDLDDADKTHGMSVSTAAEAVLDLVEADERWKGGTTAITPEVDPETEVYRTDDPTTDAAILRRAAKQARRGVPFTGADPGGFLGGVADFVEKAQMREALQAQIASGFGIPEPESPTDRLRSIVELCGYRMVPKAPPSEGYVELNAAMERLRNEVSCAPALDDLDRVSRALDELDWWRIFRTRFDPDGFPFTVGGSTGLGHSFAIIDTTGRWTDPDQSPTADAAELARGIVAKLRDGDMWTSATPAEATLEVASYLWGRRMPSEPDPEVPEVPEDLTVLSDSDLARLLSDRAQGSHLTFLPHLLHEAARRLAGDPIVRFDVSLSPELVAAMRAEFSAPRDFARNAYAVRLHVEDAAAIIAMDRGQPGAFVDPERTEELAAQQRALDEIELPDLIERYMLDVSHEATSHDLVAGLATTYKRFASGAVIVRTLHDDARFERDEFTSTVWRLTR